MPGATTAQRLAAKGCEIPFANGTTARIRFTMRAVLEVEEAFGGVAQLLDLVQTPQTYTPVFTQVRDALRCALTGQTFTSRRTLPDGTVEVDDNATYDDDRLADLLDPALLQVYIDALAAAVDEAFPPAEDAPGSGRGKARRGTGGGRGSTTRPSPSAGPAASSGT